MMDSALVATRLARSLWRINNKDDNDEGGAGKVVVIDREGYKDAPLDRDSKR